MYIWFCVEAAIVHEGRVTILGYALLLGRALTLLMYCHVVADMLHRYFDLNML